jgi:glycosyltransferase involved in cell wall biosynthesis
MRRHICVIKSRNVPYLPGSQTFGGEKNFLHVNQALLSQNYQVDVFTGMADADCALEMGNLTVFQISHPYSLDYSSYMETDYFNSHAFVISLLRNNRFRATSYTAMHTHHWSTGLVYTLAGQLRLPFSVHTPHLLAHVKAQVLGFACPPEVLEAERTMLKRADRVIALSSHEAATIGTLIGDAPNKVHIIPNGIDPLFLQAGPQPPLGDHIALCTVSRLARQKRLEQAIEITASLREAGLIATLCIIGGEYHEDAYALQLRQYARALDIEHLVTWLGNVPAAQICAVLQSSHVYIQTSRYESQGIALMEAMAIGLPVCTTDSLGIHDYFTHGRNGYIFHESQEAVNYIARLVHDHDLYSQISETNHEAARQFSWDVCTSKTLALLLDNS